MLKYINDTFEPKIMIQQAIVVCEDVDGCNLIPDTDIRRFAPMKSLDSYILWLTYAKRIHLCDLLCTNFDVAMTICQELFVQGYAVKC